MTVWHKAEEERDGRREMRFPQSRRRLLENLHLLREHVRSFCRGKRRKRTKVRNGRNTKSRRRTGKWEREREALMKGVTTGK